MKDVCLENVFEKSQVENNPTNDFFLKRVFTDEKQ